MSSKKGNRKKKNSGFQQKPKPLNIQKIDKTKQAISLCLVMIIKDEEDTIRKCITKVAPYISEYVIVDTGSTDNTLIELKAVTEELGLNGEVHERPWVDFGTNRTESLELSKGKCDYRWIIDADDTFEVPDSKINPFHAVPENADCLQILYRLNNLQYHRAQIVRSDQDWVYHGVLHEYLDLPSKANGVSQYQIPGEFCFVSADISPLKRANTLEEKYANDAKILEDALVKEPTNSRYMFYLAQSYRDSNQKLKSIENYQRRVAAGGWAEEVYYSLYMIGRLKEQLGRHPDEVTAAYSKAWEYRPERLEAAFHVVRKLREQERFVLGFTYASMAIKNPGTSDILFIEPEIWQWRLLDEFSIAAFKTGNPELGAEKIKDVIKADFFQHLPEIERNRLSKNYNHFKEAAEKKAEVIKQQKGANDLAKRGKR